MRLTSHQKPQKPEAGGSPTQSVERDSQPGVLIIKQPQPFHPMQAVYLTHRTTAHAADSVVTRGDLVALGLDLSHQHHDLLWGCRDPNTTRLLQLRLLSSMLVLCRGGFPVEGALQAAPIFTPLTGYLL